MPAESDSTAPRNRSLTKLWSDPRYLAWNAIALILAPLLLLSKAWRYFVEGRWFEFETSRWNARSRTPSLEEQWLEEDGPRIVLAGVSFGEAIMMERLAAELQYQRPEVRIAICVRDPHSRKAIAAKHSKTLVAPWPYEWIVPISNWLKRYDPDLLIFTQSFRNRSLAIAAHLSGAKVALFAGKLRPRKSYYYNLSASLYRWLFDAFDALILSDQESCLEAKRFTGGQTQMFSAGDIKFDVEPPSLSEACADSLKRWIERGGGPVVAAGSTETAAEDRMVLEAFAQLRKQVPARLLVAPRKIARAIEVAEFAKEFGFTADLRSNADSGAAEILILDTLGELAYAYQFARSAYVGGSFDGEGHNVLEPLIYGVPVCYGMRRGHFGALQIACESQGLGVRIADSRRLAEFWKSSLENDTASAAIKAKAAEIITREKGALQRTAEALLALLP